VRKLSTRFALLLAIAAVVPLVAYGVGSILSLRESAREAVKQGNKNVAEQAAAQIAEYVLSNVRKLKAAAALLQQAGLQTWQQERVLKNWALDFREFNELTLIDDSGTVVATSRLGRSTITIPGDDSNIVDGSVRMSSFSTDATDDAVLPTARLATQISDAGRDYWLVAEVRLEELWRMVDDIPVGEQGWASLIAKDGRLLAHGKPEARALVARREDTGSHPLSPTGSVNPGGADNQKAGAASKDTASSPQYWDWTAERLGSNTKEMVVGVRTSIPEYGWTVMVEQPTSEAYAVPNASQRQLILAISIALFVMLSVGYFFGRSFIGPILRLTRGTTALAEGHLEERVAVTSKDELGQLANAFNNMADRLVELQEDVRKKERQAMFGRVSIGLVHDLSTPIQNIGNACKMIVMLFDDLEYRETFKRTVERELVLIKRMLDDLRNIAKPVPLEKFPLDINKVILEVAESMHASAETSGITLETAPCFGPLWIEGDRYALNRVYGNLIKNAFQATPPQGTVVVRTVRQDGHAVVEVADTGTGIPQERLATIFDDFVTTKKRGLGLGLAISKKIVEQLGGSITVASEVGRGTTFSMRFPLTQARPEQLAS
jgi:signal transduction histidine kinase